MGNLDTIDHSRKELLVQLTNVSRSVQPDPREIGGLQRSDGAHRAGVRAVGGGLEHLQTGQKGVGEGPEAVYELSTWHLPMVRRRQQAGVLMDHLGIIRTLTSLLLGKIEYLPLTLRL